jgi:hypothetical protein
MHPVVVELDFMEPLRAFRRLLDQPGELGFHPSRERRRLRAPPFIERLHHQSMTITSVAMRRARQNFQQEELPAENQVAHPP